VNDISDKPNVLYRLAAAVDAWRGVTPQKAVALPFFTGVGYSPTGVQESSGTPAQRIPHAKLKKFSETPIPRRLINYLRFSITSLQYELEPCPDVKLTRTQQKAIKRFKRMWRSPNPDDTNESFLGKMVDDMMVAGWGVAEIRKNDGNDERPYTLWPVDGTSVETDLAWKGERRKARWWQWNWLKRPDSESRRWVPFRNDEMMVWRYVPRTSTPFGLSPIEVAFAEIGYLLDAMAFAGRTASNAQPKKLLWLEGLDQEQINTIRAWWKSDIAGGGEFPIMGAPDTKASTLELGMTTDQNLFLKWQEFLIAVIADAFGIDVQKVNLIVGINRSTGDTLSDATDSVAIEPLANMIEQYVQKHLLPLFDLDEAVEFKFKFTTSVSDQKAIATVNQIETQDENATLNECRARMGRGPLLHPITGEDIGNVSVSFYRELLKIPEFRIRGWKGLEEALKQAQELADAKTAPTDDGGDGSAKEFGENENNTSDDPTKRGGNGVYGAPTPKDEPLNRANERENDV
jgi:phage portal protein BeeE